MKKCTLLALLLALLMLCVPGLAEEGGQFVMMGLDTGEDPRDWNENLFFSRMEDLTGVSFTFHQYVNEEAYQAAKDQAFASGDLPDVLFKAHLTPEEEMRYLQSGQLVDLAPYLQEYAPNLYAILEARPEWRAVITQPDGAIASLPILNGAERQAVLWINRGWLDALGLAMPTTIDEYTDVLRAFRDGDANQNGRTNDETPLSLIGPWEARFMLHAWGLVPNDYNIYVDDAGAVQFAPFDPRYREFVEWVVMAQNEGLINADAFRTIQSGRTEVQSSSSESNEPLTLGGFVSIAPYTVLNNMDNTTSYAALLPLAYEGEQVYRQLLNGVGRGTFAITSACDDIPAMLSWVDTLYTEEGGRLAFAGEAVTDYILEADGTWRWNSGEDYYLLADLVKNNTIANDTATPGLEPAAFMRNSEITADNYTRRQTDLLRGYLVEPFPVTWPTDAAREERIAALQTPLATSVDMHIANFALGKVELSDETWQAFMDELRELGADEFVSLWQAKYDEIG